MVKAWAGTRRTWWAGTSAEDLLGQTTVREGPCRLKSCSSQAAPDLADVEVDLSDWREQRRVDEQAADVDALAVAVLRDLQPVLDGLGARDERLDVRQLLVGERAQVCAGVGAAVVGSGERR